MNKTQVESVLCQGQAWAWDEALEAMQNQASS